MKLVVILSTILAVKFSVAVIGINVDVDGGNTDVDDTNFVVLMVLNGTNYTKVCAGTVIDPSWILTTASCLSNVQANIEKITALETIKPKINLLPNISTIIMHEAYNFWDNNIGLIKLWQPIPGNIFEFNVKITPDKNLPDGGVLLSWNKDNHDPDRIAETYLDFDGAEKRYTGTHAMKNVKNGYYLGISGAPIVTKVDKWELIAMYSHTSIMFDSTVDNNDYNYVDLTKYFGWIYKKLSTRVLLAETTTDLENNTAAAN